MIFWKTARAPVCSRGVGQECRSLPWCRRVGCASFGGAVVGLGTRRAGSAAACDRDVRLWRSSASPVQSADPEENHADDRWVANESRGFKAVREERNRADRGRSPRRSPTSAALRRSGIADPNRRVRHDLARAADLSGVRSENFDCERRQVDRFARSSSHVFGGKGWPERHCSLVGVRLSVGASSLR